ncbi:MAG TPA: DUF2007 domain-containing protein [Firmicutes bacterium]|uniref:DUF2007 domain-containing protein n=1 Tax=Capillibacterium thermochitinicola TaxID=2699427 RepID=A0A8J6LSE0_9FIRM|nr:DUF2007 domain-containing protein [Capillibacterium thermochitinicola]MBA2133187.1 DUF2007 domain-containing protein [Capillibacterium thermochitinicola]HHW12079.1 DUF2007 domain-containing protein [Bacillota bacterium]
MSTHTQWRTLTEVNNPLEADLIKSLLAGAGIRCFIPDRNLNQIYGGAFGLKIQVPADDLPQAKALLTASPFNHEPDNPCQK